MDATQRTALFPEGNKLLSASSTMQIDRRGALEKPSNVDEYS